MLSAKLLHFNFNGLIDWALCGMVYESVSVVMWYANARQPEHVLNKRKANYM